MSNLAHALKSVSWMGMLKLLSQLCSWAGTIIITRLLTSEDYGIMELATVFTGYITYFVEFGVGAALVNKKDLTEEEKSSAFWSLCLWGLLLSGICIILAPVTAAYFNEPRVAPLTQSVGFLFIFGSISIVPRALLQRDLRFKDLGKIELCTTFFSVIFSVLFAYYNMGPWTLIGSFIFREFLNTILYFVNSKFSPKMHFNFQEIVPHLKFGLPVVISSSLYYVYTKSDRFFGGSVLGAETLGYYAVALQLAAIPVEKIVTLIQGVLYPTLSKVKDDIKEFQKTYLCFISIVALVTFPIYFSGFVLADEIVPYLIGEKWRPAMPSFKLLLIGQAFMAISSPNSLVHFARGKPKWNMFFNLCLTPVLVCSFYYSAQLKNLDLLACPWVYVYPVFTLSYIFLTNREVKISILRYSRAFIHPLSVSLLLVLFSCLYREVLLEINIYKLVSYLLISFLIYVGYFLTFGMKYFLYLRSILRNAELDAEMF